MEDSTLANLSVRKIDDEILARLRVRAAQHGISMEEEARQILRRAVAAPNRLGDLALRFFGSEYGVDLDLPKHQPHEPLEFSE
jgi:antitoxin FitA